MAGDEGHQVFISHSHTDRGAADEIYNTLSSDGVRCWIAGEHSIPPGDSWPSRIVEALTNSDLLLLVFSAHAAASEQVSREIGLAQQLNRKVLPVRIDGNAEPRGSMAYYLADVQWLNAIPLDDGSFQRLKRRVRELLETTSPPSTGSTSLTVGKFEFKLGEPGGGAVIATNEPAQAWRPARQNGILPRVTRLHGRERELALALREFKTGESVAFYGPSGVGKTTMLRAVAAHARARAIGRDGVMLVNARRRSLNDLCERIFSAIYDTTLRRPTEAELRDGLRERVAVVALDDLSSAVSLPQLAAIMPQVRFVVASLNARQDATSITELKGLAEAAGFELLEERIGRQMSAEERASARALFATIGGAPAAIVAIATVVRRQGRSLVDVAREFDTGWGELAPRLRATVSSPAGYLLEASALVGGAPLSHTALAAIAGVDDPTSAIEDLTSTALADNDGLRLSIPRAEPGPGPSELHIERLRIWFEQRRGHIDDIADDLPALSVFFDRVVAGGRHTDVVRCGRILGEPLLRAGFWDTAKRDLEQTRVAASAARDAEAEMWAQRELDGWRALREQREPSETGKRKGRPGRSKRAASPFRKRYAGVLQRAFTAIGAIAATPKRKKITALAAGLSTAVIALTLLVWPRSAETGACVAPNSADQAGMQRSITRFHETTVAHDEYAYLSARNYADAAFIGTSDEFQRGYAKTASAVPSDFEFDGCHATIRLQYGDEDGATDCRVVTYDMEYKRTNLFGRRHWIIHSAHQPPLPCD